MEKQGIDYLRNKLNIHARRADVRYMHYAMKQREKDVGITIPKRVRDQYKSVLGWCTKGVNSLADRLVFREFINDDFEVSEIFNANNPDIFFDSLILSTLITSCSFVYISQGENETDEPRLQIIDARNATGIIDPITGLLVEGYAVLDTDEYGKKTIEAHFLPDRTDYYYNGDLKDSFENEVGHPLLVPVIHRPDADRPFGRSRITRACMYHQSYAKRTLERADVTAEFYSFPQKYVVGTDPDAEEMDTWRATISTMLEFTASEDGTVPKLGQFNPSSMTPFTEQLRNAAAGFAGETGLTLDDLGFVSDNPSSAEAFKASHENLRLAGRKAQRSISSGLKNVAYLAACLRDDFSYTRGQFNGLETKWEPMFEADANTLNLIGDGALKLNQAVDGYVDKEVIRDLTGIKGGGGNG